MRLPGLTGEESTSLSGGARSGDTAGTLRGKCPAGVPSARGAPPNIVFDATWAAAGAGLFLAGKGTWFGVKVSVDRISFVTYNTETNVA